jgi:hypothetical protein
MVWNLWVANAPESASSGFPLENCLREEDAVLLATNEALEATDRIILIYFKEERGTEGIDDEESESID